MFCEIALFSSRAAAIRHNPARLTGPRVSNSFTGECDFESITIMSMPLSVIISDGAIFFNVKDA